MKKAVALIGMAFVLAGCGGVPTGGGVPQAGIGTLSIVLPDQLKVTGGIQAARVQERETSIRHTWELTKVDDPNDGKLDTATFTVTATKKTVSGTAITSLVTTVGTASGQDIKICNIGSSGITLTGASVTLVGYDASSAALAPTIDLSGIFAVPIPLAAGACTSAAFSVNSANTGSPTVTVDAAQAAMLNNAATFAVKFSASTASTVVNGTTSAATPTFQDNNHTTVIGDDSVTLSDPGFQPVTGTLPMNINTSTTVQVFKTFTCDNPPAASFSAQSVIITKQYNVPNTAYLTGPNTNLQASDTDVVTLSCAAPPPPVMGCTYTQGYYKTHAEYFKGALNKKYDRNAWNGAYDWTGTTLVIGGKPYTQQALVGIYNTSVSGNQALALFHQFATAKLNTLKLPPAGTTTGVADAMDAAESFFAANPNWLSGSYSGDPSAWISTLDSFNNGLYSAHCD